MRLFDFSEVYWSPVLMLKSNLKRSDQPGVVEHTCNPSTWEAEAKSFGLHNKFLC
jgi:hypothetical protein